MSDDMNPDFGLDDGGSTDASDSSTEAGDAVFQAGNETTDYSSTDTVDDSLFDGETSIDPVDSGDDAEPITMSYDGASYDVGPATFDADGDGVADTAVQDSGYQVEYYVDSDGDGQADELTVTDADGNVVSHTENVDGSWQPTEGPDAVTGPQPMDQFQGDEDSSDDSGTDGPDADSDSGSGYGDDSDSGSGYGDDSDSGSGYGDSGSGGSGGHMEGAMDGGSGSDEPGSGADHDSGDSDGGSADSDDSDEESGSGSDSAGDEPAGSSDDEPEESAPADESGASDDQGSSGAASGDLTVTIDGEDIVVGEPTLDISGDGVADTVVVESDGNMEYYVDTDGDGIADQIIVLDESDGTLVNHEVYDPATGTWTNVTEESSGSQD